MLIVNLALVNTFGQYLVDLGGYMDAYMVNVSVHGSWLILHGSFSTEFVEGLDDYCSSSMVIDRSAACFKGKIQIFEHLPCFWTWLTWTSTDMVITSIGISL